MNGNDNWIKRTLITAGLFELVGGLSHAVMPHYIYKSAGFSLLQPNEVNSISLAVFSVGILLVAFGTLTIIFALNHVTANKKILFHFVSIKAILWTMRIILEFLYPTKIPMFSIKQLTVILIPMFIFICCLFTFSNILISNDIRKKNVEILNPQDKRHSIW